MVVLADKKLSETYSYLEIINGHGTLATYHKKPEKNNLPFFKAKMEELLGIKIEEPKLFGARGNFILNGAIKNGETPYIGESAGFQDALAGFGMVLAIDSAQLVARSIIGEQNYRELCEKEMKPRLKASYVNKGFRKLIPNLFINIISKAAGRKQRNYRQLLFWLYNYSFAHKILFPIFRGIEIMNFRVSRFNLDRKTSIEKPR
jgi:flavin-dependent dehydrogenase